MGKSDLPEIYAWACKAECKCVYFWQITGAHVITNILHFCNSLAVVKESFPFHWLYLQQSLYVGSKWWKHFVFYHFPQSLKLRTPPWFYFPVKNFWSSYITWASIIIKVYNRVINFWFWYFTVIMMKKIPFNISLQLKIVGVVIYISLSTPSYYR